MDSNNKQYWKGLDELHNAPEFEKHRHNEFAEKLPTNGVMSTDDLELKSSRRDFLKFLGFGITATTLAACSQTPVRHAVPYANKPVEIEPGVPNYYASTCAGCNARCSLLVKTREGRPIKIEGNYDSPFSKGGVCAVGQATVLSLYDLGRLSHPTDAKKDITWKGLDEAVISALNEGGAIRILTGTVSSPSTQAAINEFIGRYPSARHIQYDASSASALRLAHEKAFGKAVTPWYKIDQAKTVVSFGADFLGTWISPVEHTKMYVSARKADSKPEDFLQHFQFESHLSLTGSNADFRGVLSPSQFGQAIVSMRNMIANRAGQGAAGSSNFELAGNSIAAAANALWKNRGRSIVLCGSNDINHQIVVADINRMLGNYGTTIDIDNPSYQRMGSDRDMINLVNEMNAGTVNTLIIYDANPAYTYPKGFSEALKKVKTSISLGQRLDETSSIVKYVAPDHHFLESWGDEMPREGYMSIYQPTISPIFNTRSAIESFLVWAGRPMNAVDWVKRQWQAKGVASGNFQDFWNKSLEAGFITTAQKTQGTATFNADVNSAASAASQSAYAKDKYEVAIYEKVGLRDGKEANNPWLQELPDPISKISWDNYAALSPKLAEELGVNDEDVITIEGGGHSVDLPVLRQPGMRYGAVGIAAGYGRGKNMEKDNLKVAFELGKNAYPFATVTGDSIIYGGQQVTIKKKGETYPLAMSQTHHHMEGRDLVRETTIADYASGAYAKEVDAKKGHEAAMHISLWRDYRFPGHHWGMAIDLNACTGCNACVVSCIAENNTPVVGKDEVRRRREMHWLRIDRYYSLGEESSAPIHAQKEHAGGHGEAKSDDGFHNKYKELDALAEEKKLGNYEKVRVVFQPILCQHCTNAPCESVCPVNAISHSSEGLNQQAYNRCVGTRYCANNCPYKVRRFNWFNYALHEKFEDYNMQNNLGRMVLNPDVTVRQRGVMEKCSFCVQRVQIGKLDAKKEGRTVRDGEVKTACQQTCPANAIVFGDMNDPNSEISKLIENKRTYQILTELNTRPAVNYMTKVRNFSTENQA